MCSTSASSENARATSSRAVWARSVTVASSSTRDTAFAIPCSSPGSTMNPLMPSLTTLATPPTRPATTGVPAAWASIRLTGVPSLSEVSTTASLAKQTSGMSRRKPAQMRRPVQRGRLGARLERSAQLSVAHDEEVHARTLCGEAPGDAKETVHPLDRHEPSDQRDDLVVGRNAQLGAEPMPPSGSFVGTGAEWLEVEPQRHDLEAVGVRHAQLDELVADFVADRDQRIGAAREGPLDPPVDRARYGARSTRSANARGRCGSGSVAGPTPVPTPTRRGGRAFLPSPRACG